jgi:glycosyltransferase involved in cell wall biosynthesis
MISALEKNNYINIICLTEKGQSAPQIKVKYNEKITIHYVNQKDFNGKNFFKRAFFEILYIRQLIAVSNTLHHDLLIATAPYMFMIPLVGIFGKNPKIIDVRDLVWEYLDDKGIVKKIIKKTLSMLMKYGMSKFDHILVTNQYEADQLLNQDHFKNVHIASNGIDQASYTKLTAISPRRDIPFTVTYVGNIGLAQDIKTLINAAQKLPDIHFVIIGNGIELPSLMKYVEINNIQNVTFTGKLSWDELKEYYESSSVLYAHLDKKFVSAMPSKLYEYASVGLPIIYGGVGQAVSFIEKLENAISIAPNDVQALIEAITTMRNSKLSTSEKNRSLIKENYLREASAQYVAQLATDLFNSIKEKK